VAEAVAGQKSKVVAGVLGILLGGFGAHRFYLGDVTGGIIRLVLSLCFGLGAVIGLIEGIIYLTKSDEDFQKIYVEQKKGWF
jgi:TM2 domain-containing membrane protein YozV